MQYRLLEAIEEENEIIMQLKDQSITYEYEVNHPHDKIFRLGLDNKEEVANFLNEKLDIEYELKRRKFRKI